MPIWNQFRNWISGRADRDLERELRAHLDMEGEEQQESGLAAEDARYAARRAFGNTTSIQEETRAMWGWTLIETFAQDLRYALRGMGKNPGFTAVAVLSLALGIGSATAVFSVLDAAVLRPMPVREAERLVIVRPTLRGERFVLFNPYFEELRRRQTTLVEMFAVQDTGHWKTTFEGDSAPAYSRGSKVSGNYFSALGLAPALGRLLTEADDQILGTPESSGCAVVLSHAAWTQRFQRDAGVLGRGVEIGATACSIVGVAPEQFQSVQAGFAPELWAPMRALTDRSLLENRRLAFFSGVMGRLCDGVTAAEAETELTTLYQQIMAAEPPSAGGRDERPRLPAEFAIQLLPGGHGLGDVSHRYGRPLALVMAVAGIVLLIAAMNVANLLLARGAVRGSELATRVALGAGRARLVCQLVTEGALLAIFGGALGVAFAQLSIPSLAALVSLPYLPVALETAPDQRVLFAALAATMLAALLAGALPALRLTGQSLQAAISTAGRTIGSRPGQRLARALVSSQLALSLLLVSGAGLLLRTVVQLASVDAGFDPAQVVLLSVNHEKGRDNHGEVDEAPEKARLAALYASLESELNSLPGVRSASLSWLGLFGGSDLWLRLIDPENTEDRRDGRVDYVSPGYFDTVGMRVLRGRGFTAADGASAPRVAVVNETLARQRFGQGEALGRRLALDYRGEADRPFTIVGIVGDSKYNDLREAKIEPMMWTPLGQATFHIKSVALRIDRGTQAAVVRETQRVLRAADNELMVRQVTTLSDQVAQSTARERLLLGLASGFGGLALLLAAIGLYGTLTHAVARRTREIGVRLALGAQRGTVLRMVVGDALRLALWGLLAGVPLALAAGYALRGFLFGVEPYDAVALSGACFVLTLVATVAAYVPARKASRVNPIEALRYE
ncbi:MAG: ABC transporter permease [Bryobacterales bacterium]